LNEFLNNLNSYQIRLSNTSINWIYDYTFIEPIIEFLNDILKTKEYHVDKEELNSSLIAPPTVEVPNEVPEAMVVVPLTTEELSPFHVQSILTFVSTFSLAVISTVTFPDESAGL
jgi:hypothetical protein